MDVDRQGIDAQASQPSAVWPTTRAHPVMPVLSVEERLRRRQAQSIAMRVAALVFDAAMINVAFVVAYLVRYRLLQGVTFGPTRYAGFTLEQFRLLEAAVTGGLLLTFYARGLYRLRPTGTWFKQASVVVAATSAALAVFAAYEFVLQSTTFAVLQTRLFVALIWASAIVFVCLGRLALATGLGWLHRRGVGMTNLLVVGSGRLAKLMMQHIAASPGLGYRVVGFVHDLEGPPTDFGRFKVLGTMADLDRSIRDNRVGEVIIALPSHQHQQILRAVRLCERAGADFKLVPDLYELSLSRIDVDAVEGVPLIGLRRSLHSSWQRGIKRTLDVLVAGTILLVGAPLWLLVALAIKVDSTGPVLYSQERMGFRGERFGMLKFRSMHENADRIHEQLRAQNGGSERTVIYKDRRDPRRTRVGRFIRRMSIDEIPNLINVLRGEMSLVGPRPPLPSEVEEYEDWERARLEATPGITGLWQVRGRSDIDFDEMVLMDLYYIENWSLRLDLQILLRTVPAVLFSHGAY